MELTITFAFALFFLGVVVGFFVLFIFGTLVVQHSEEIVQKRLKEYDEECPGPEETIDERFKRGMACLDALIAKLEKLEKNKSEGREFFVVLEECPECDLIGKKACSEHCGEAKSFVHPFAYSAEDLRRYNEMHPYQGEEEAKPWSKSHPHCKKCKRTDKKHHGKGLCHTCWSHEYHKKHSRKR
jgi:Na+-transporting methylmalonyl-CoA/oxaloacetate decarboxylase gamma subunit